MYIVKPTIKLSSSTSKLTVADLLTYSNPTITWIVYGAIIAGLLRYSHVCWQFEFVTIYIVFSAGLKCWSLFEYIFHRFVDTWLLNHPAIEKHTYVFHLNHHHFPGDRKRLFMPVIPGLALMLLLFVLTYMAMPKYGWLFFPGFLLGHLIQLSIHYAIHAYPAPSKYLKSLWRSHLMHHACDASKGFGITSTFWDYVFGTRIKTKHDKTQHVKTPDNH